jgi:fucose 4-O-acetylase-like acetyltransferase
MGNNPSIDLLKGVLILLVMGGHAMEIAQQQHLALWIGAGFRMPLMIGVSGYLLNVARTRESPGGDLARRYGKRMLLPWAVAMVIYFAASGAPVSWRTPLDMLLRPHFHLWYVSVLYVLIMLTRLLPLAPARLLLLGAPVSLATMYAFGLEHGPIGQGVLAIDSRFVRYPVYFFFGVLMAQQPPSARHRWVALTVMTLGLLWWSSLRGTGDGLALVPARLMMNLGLIALLPALAEARLSIGPINRIGRNSLFFYLWHPLAMGLAVAFSADTTFVPLLLLSVILLLGASHVAGRTAAARLLTGAVKPRDRRASALAEGSAATA